MAVSLAVTSPLLKLSASRVMQWHGWMLLATLVVAMVHAGTLCPKGSFVASSGACTLCPAGSFGAIQGLTTPACSGPCAGGYFCPMGSTSPTAQQCGSPNYYCPPGTPQRRVVSPGYFTVTSSDGKSLGDLQLEPYTATAQTQCDVGHFCVRGIQYKCPLGTFGQTRGLTSKQCSGQCPPGSYCPIASPAPVACPPGVYGATSGLQTSLCSGLCPRANYCLMATVVPEPCPAGLFGNSTGLVSKHCSSICTESSCVLPYCRAGFYCPLGTLAPLECGSIEVYCPEGSSTPTAVSPGHYTIATPTLNTADVSSYVAGQAMALSSTTTRVNQQICERGMYCIHGLKSPCPAGTYGATEGLTTRLCTGSCPAGYYCPEGSPDYSHFACLDPSAFCPLGSSTPVEASTGFFTLLSSDGRLRIGQQVCPAGSYCVRGVAHLCPLGTFGSTTGLSSPLCSGRCAPGSVCPLGSTSSQQQPCAAGTYTTNGQSCAPCRPGFWCGVGSASPTQNECGGTSVFCPLGSSGPSTVQVGFYSANANSNTFWNGDFTAQVQCPVAATALIPQCPSITVGPNGSL